MRKTLQTLKHRLLEIIKENTAFLILLPAVIVVGLGIGFVVGCLIPLAFYEKAMTAGVELLKTRLFDTVVSFTAFIAFWCILHVCTPITKLLKYVVTAYILTFAGSVIFYVSNANLLFWIFTFPMLPFLVGLMIAPIIEERQKQQAYKWLDENVR
jgi:hypothetical protein